MARTDSNQEDLMGSVRDLYTTGDNDPEIEPQHYYRHYLYCDSCGSFDLHPYTEFPETSNATEQKRYRLAMAAFVLVPVAAGGALVRARTWCFLRPITLVATLPRPWSLLPYCAAGRLPEQCRQKVALF